MTDSTSTNELAKWSEAILKAVHESDLTLLETVGEAHLDLLKAVHAAHAGVMDVQASLSRLALVQRLEGLLLNGLSNVLARSLAGESPDGLAVELLEMASRFNEAQKAAANAQTNKTETRSKKTPVPKRKTMAHRRKRPLA